MKNIQILSAMFIYVIIYMSFIPFGILFVYYKAFKDTVKGIKDHKRKQDYCPPYEPDNKNVTEIKGIEYNSSDPNTEGHNI